MGKITNWPPNDVIHCGCFNGIFYKTLSVIHVIRGFRGHKIHFLWYDVHLISSQPIFWNSEERPNISPHPPKSSLIEQNDFDINHQQFPHILGHCDAFCDHSVWNKSYKRLKSTKLSCEGLWRTLECNRNPTKRFLTLKIILKIFWQETNVCLNCTQDLLIVLIKEGK